MSDQQTIDTGDIVAHGPTGENWTVAYVEGDRLAWVGWPEGEAELADCTLVRKATPEEREKLLLDLAKLDAKHNGHLDRRCLVARRRLAGSPVAVTFPNRPPSPREQMAAPLPLEGTSNG